MIEFKVLGALLELKKVSGEFVSGLGFNVIESCLLLQNCSEKEIGPYSE